MDEFMEKVHRYLNYPISRDQAYRRRKYAKEIIERKCKNCGALGHNKRICKSSEQRVEDEGPTQGLQQSVLFDLVQTSQTSRLINFHSSEVKKKSILNSNAFFSFVRKYLMFCFYLLNVW